MKKYWYSSLLGSVELCVRLPTGAADAVSVFGDCYVITCVRMAMHAMRKAAVPCGKRLAPEQILPMRDSFEMARTNAKSMFTGSSTWARAISVVAEVVDVHFCGNFTERKKIRELVRRPSDPSLEGAVTPSGARTSPEPTIVSLVDLLPKASLDGWRLIKLARLPFALVMSPAQMTDAGLRGAAFFGAGKVGNLYSHLELILSGAMRTAVSAARPPSILPRIGESR